MILMSHRSQLKDRRDAAAMLRDGENDVEARIAAVVLGTAPRTTSAVSSGAIHTMRTIVASFIVAVVLGTAPAGLRHVVEEQLEVAHDVPAGQHKCIQWKRDS